MELKNTNSSKKKTGLTFLSENICSTSGKTLDHIICLKIIVQLKTTINLIAWTNFCFYLPQIPILLNKVRTYCFYTTKYYLAHLEFWIFDSYENSHIRNQALSLSLYVCVRKNSQLYKKKRTLPEEIHRWFDIVFRRQTNYKNALISIPHTFIDIFHAIFDIFNLWLWIKYETHLSVNSCF